MPQNWLFLGSYRKQRERLLRELSWNLLGRLGAGAFETISGDVVNAILLILTNALAPKDFELVGVDASGLRNVVEKAERLRNGELARVSQSAQLSNPDCRIVLAAGAPGELLERYASALAGINTGDYPRFGRVFIELDRVTKNWELQQTTTAETSLFAGASQLFK